MPPSPDLAQASVSDVGLGAGPVPSLWDSPRWRTLRRLVVRAALAAAVLTAVLALALTLAITQSIDLPFVRNHVEAAIERILGAGYSVSTDRAVLAMDPVLGLVARLADTTIHDGLGQEVARVPAFILAIRPVALVTPQNVIHSIEIDNPWISVRREGGIAIIGNGATPVPGADAAPAETLAVDSARLFPEGLDILAHPVEAINSAFQDVLDLAGRGFDRIGLTNATVELWRNDVPTPHIYRRTDLRIAANARTGRLSAQMTGAGYSSRWSISAERMSNPLTGGASMVLNFSQLTVTDLFVAMGGGRSNIYSDIPLYGRAVVGLDADGHVAGASATLDLGSGQFAFGPTATPIVLDEATIRLGWDVASDTIIVQPSPFVFGEGGATVAGIIRPDGNGRFAFDLWSPDAVLAPRDSPAPPLPAELLRVTGVVDLADRVIEIDRATIDTARGSLSAAAIIGLEPGAPSLALAAELSEMPTEVLQQIWPPGLEDSGRRWVLEHVTGGQVAGTLEAAIPAGILAGRGDLTPDMIGMRLTLDGVSFRTFDGFPDVTDAHGVAVLSGSNFAVDLDGARTIAPTGDVVEVTAATFVISETAAAIPTGHIEMHATGPAAAFGAIADLEPMAALQKIGMPAGSLHGSGSAIMSASWPLVEGMAPGEVQWRVGLTMTGLGSDVAFQGMTIGDGDVFIDVTPSIVDITGVGTVNGVPAEIDLSFPLAPEIDGRQHIQMVLDDAARDRLGLELDYLLGGTVRAIARDLGGGAPGQHYELDLEQARVNLDALGWAKPVGVPAVMSFDIVPIEGGQHVRNIRVEGNGFGFVGEVYLDENSAIVRADLTEIHLRPADSLALTVERAGNGWTVDVAGASFDARGLLTDGLAALNLDGDGPPTDIAIHGRFDRMIGFHGEALQDAEIAYVARGGDVQLLSIAGRLNGSDLYLVIEDNGAGTDVSVHISDAGSLLRFANIYDNIRGGELWIVGTEQADGSIRGRLTLTGFNVVDEPGLTRLMAPPPGTPAELATTVSFESLEFDFVQRGVLLMVQEGLLRGGNMGAVAAGRVDLGNGEIALTGTYIPAYVVNNLFGRLPIIGLALGGGQREGLIGMTFQIVGPLNDAVLEINPLSLIAPGIFRKLFEFQ